MNSKRKKKNSNKLPSNSHPVPVPYPNKKRRLTSFVPKYPYSPCPYPSSFFALFLPMRKGRTTVKEEGGQREREELHGQ